MKVLIKYQKKISLGLLMVMFFQLIIPNISYALTSGPSQPEMKGFEPIGNSDMVDLFSGDFSYNIPLMDVGGYPVNLAYHSGASMDDEATWVGYGWSLNVGAVNRQLRGIPDDFNGTDKQQRELKIKDHVTKGGRFSMTLDLLGIPTDRIKFRKKKNKLNMSLTVSVGIKADNYRGLGMELGFNPGLSLTEYASGEKTPSDSMDAQGTKGIPVDGGLTLSSQDGASANINAQILLNKTGNEDKSTSLSKSIGFGYNSRAGLTGMTLGTSFSASTSHKWDDDQGKHQKDFNATSSSNSFISFNGESYTPTIDHPTKINSFTFALHLGPEVFVGFPGMGVSGFYSNQSIAQKLKLNPSYGYMYSEQGKDEPNALMDFNREKDIPYSSQVNYLPIPIPTYDLFNATSQDGSGQYRLYRGSSGVFFDPKKENTSIEGQLGIEIGAGTYFDVGADLYFQDLKTKTQKWIDRNNFLGKGDFQNTSNDPLYEKAYFKRVGEPVPYDEDFVTKIKNTSAVSVELPSKIGNAVAGAEASDKLRTQSSMNGESTSILQRSKREVRNTTFSYLTAKEAANHGLEKTIKDYNPDSLSFGSCNTGGIRNSFQRTGSYRKSHHISEITVTGDDGKRSVYGIPVYNTYQEEVSFSVPQNLSLRKKGLINYQNGVDNSFGNKNGLENYYSREITPSYATSYLLTAILSSDYVDVTHNGVTDDDLGTAVKFNYSKLPSLFKWRTPYAFGKDTANYNEGFMSDALDDKANYVYGEKEVWFLHSIESKTMIAQFVTEDRDDGLGVVNSEGAVDNSVRIKRLKEIRLYSKSDLKLNGNDPSKTIPIKVVQFVYDYTLCKGLPNSINHVGKLTLKSVYFTFGFNNKGRLNPYSFQYDTSYNFYDYRQYDRWGNFKNASDNPGGLNNSEFPYVIQDTSKTNHYSSAWQLNKITLPSGGSININYESDDYAYVQDRRASQMCMVNGVGSTGSGTNLVGADYIYINLPYPVSSDQEMRDRYFDGITNLYFKFLLDLDAKGHKEFVPGYAELDPSVKPTLISGSIAKIKLKKINGINPIAKAGWQFLRMSLPKYAYPGSDNLEDNGSDLKKAIKALVTAFGTIKELFYGFEKRAKNKGFSNNVDVSKSWVRLCSPSRKKLGGGSRVKRIDISDDWATMSGTTGAKTATYTQLYDYTTKDAKGNIISSGAASYEPSLGGDENPFHQPIRYKQNQFLALDNFYYIEEPFCESLYPGASVGYSKVTVKTIGTGDAETVNRTGTVVSEFFTAKDYPVAVEILNLERRKPATDKIFKLISGISYDMLGLSQGYSIQLNDMHGKPRTVNVYNKSGQNISSVEYFYKTVNESAEKKQLINDVKIIDGTGTVSDGSIGMDVEMYTDMRQQTTENLGVSVKVSGGSGAIVFFPLPFFFPGIGVNYDKRSYRAASTIKIVNRFAIQYKVKKVENGSSITSENLLWDSETGNVLLTKTQNEFDDPVYSFAYPAHWIYDRMGQAYQNLGTILTNFSTGSGGTVSNSAYNGILVPGDELIDINSSTKYWVANSPVSNSYQKRIINETGAIQSLTGLSLKLIRSGRRNMANTAIATVSSLNNPIVGDKLDVTLLTKILDAKATVFSEEWSMPVKVNCNQPVCPDGCVISADSTYCVSLHYPQPSTKSDFDTVCSRGNAAYSSFGSYIYTTYDKAGRYTTTAPTQIDPANSWWINSGTSTNGPMNRCAIWRCGSDTPTNKWQGFTAQIHIPTTKTYYIGLGGDNQVQIIVDGDTIVSQNQSLIGAQWGNVDRTFKIWHIFPVTLNAGLRIIELKGLNSEAVAGFGAEIYDNTSAELIAAHSYSDLRIVFSSKDYKGRRFQPGVYSGYVCDPGFELDTTGGLYMCRDTSIHPIGYGINNVINPYSTGILGNWRAKSQYVYQINRENITGDISIKGNTNIRKSGAYSVFNPFWKYNTTSLLWEKNPTNDAKWIAANEVTYFNGKGLEIENKDALNRYSSALFGYLESMPVAVGSNSRYREIAYDGFEDYGFNLDCALSDTCNKGHFNFRKLLNGTTVDVSNLYAHSGKYSLKLNGSVTIAKTIFTGDPDSLYGFNSTGQYLLKANELAKGFSPIPGKKYVLSFWVNDANPRDATTNVQATFNGTALLSNLSKWPIVEGWKRIETVFTIPSVATSFSLNLQSSGTVYFDDIRIHPFDAQMKSFAYDPSSQRLMAELDENNFATLYEYDDEGILIRVKKETERGIMTIKETRSSYRKH